MEQPGTSSQIESILNESNTAKLRILLKSCIPNSDSTFMNWIRSTTTLALVILAFGCTRPSANKNSNQSQISFRAPSSNDFFKASTQSSSIPAGYKACFAVNVIASDLPTSQHNSCSPKLGSFAGYVEGNANLSLSVPKGSARTFQLIVQLVPPTQSCPQLNPAHLSDYDTLRFTYLAGQTAGIDLKKDEESVSIKLEFPGLLDSEGSKLSAVCLPNPSLKAYLSSSGHVYSAAATQLPLFSAETNEGFYMTGYADGTGIGQISASSSVSFNGSVAAQVPSWLTSLTKKPDQGTYYAIDLEGQIYQLQLDASMSTPVKLGVTAGDCPFSVVDCKVPPWIQSISAGYNANLFGIDHGGNLYQLGAAAPVLMSNVILNESVSQVSFY